MSEPALRFVEPGSAEYDGERRLRWRVLRQPLGRPPGSELFPFEAECLHLVAVDAQGEVVGCVMFHPEGEGAGRLLQMAVAPELQGTGLGRRLVRALEARLVELGVREVTLHARANVCGFYARLGYEPFGEPYEEVGIPHRSMRRALGGGD